MASTKMKRAGRFGVGLVLVAVVASTAFAETTRRTSRRAAPPAPPPIDAATLSAFKSRMLPQLKAMPVAKPSLSGPVTLGPNHLAVSSGAASLKLGIGAASYVADTFVEFGFNLSDRGFMIISLAGFKGGERLLLDCSFDVTTAGTSQVEFSTTGIAADGIHPAHLAATVPITNGHLLYAFEVAGNDDFLQFSVAVTNPGQQQWAHFYGCALSPI